jgi:hypothetical protein
MAPKSIDIFYYLFKSHYCLDQSESISNMYHHLQCRRFRPEDRSTNPFQAILSYYDD